MTEKKTDVESIVRNIRRETRKKYSVEEKIRIVLEGLRGENTVAELCRKEGINQKLYYKWSKEFLEAGKERLVGNQKRQAGSNQVKGLRRENEQLKQLAVSIGVRGVTMYIFYEKYAVMGLRPYPAFQEVMELLQKENALVE